MLYSSGNIPYQEYRAINELMGAHPQELKDSLKAMIVFGEIVATGESQDINLLEIVAGWQGPRHVSYGSTAALPLRGRLHLYFLTPEEFEQPRPEPVPGQTWSSAQILSRVRPAYAVLLEEPYDYAHDVMARLEGVLVIGSSSEDALDRDPIAFLKCQTVAA